MPLRPFLFAMLLGVAPLLAATPVQAGDAPETVDKGMVMLTIFLRHDESKTLDEINAQLTKQRYFESFPPKDVEIVSWYVMMGIGQVVTLRFPAERLRDVNRAIERTAWGPYRTEFYPTYDYKPSALAERKAP